MELLETINTTIAILFAVLYAYQFLYIPAVWILRGKKARGEHPRTGRLRYAALICARNESAVIANLIESLRGQTYRDVTVFVLADNCTDDTAIIARKHGAVVYTRQDAENVGKGYALNALLGHIREDYPRGFDGYFVFDADNLLAPDYIECMDAEFRRGHDIVTGYRNSTNFGANWISAGYALWFLHESRYLNHARYVLGQSCAVGGTGFLFSREIAEEMGGWPYHTLTEDIEFSIANITRGRRIAFCPEAELYDEQPTDLAQSWRQRTRWAKGYYQVFARYGGKLLRGILHGSFSCYDMTASNMPAFIAALTGIATNAALIVCGAIRGDVLSVLPGVCAAVVGTYLTLFFVGAVATATEWRRIRASNAKKVAYMFTFPLFMLTYIPISVAALFAKAEWKPIVHYGAACGEVHDDSPHAA